MSPEKAFTLKGPGRIIKACRELMVIISGRLKTGLHPMLLVALFWLKLDPRVRHQDSTQRLLRLDEKSKL